ncbi:MAG: type I restriction enzyme HsdR N-terminal domain-containing protein [Prevotellaceae bacterium]|jgi:DNA modification methylase|nr:type I restriction enzyme HsdR N-terminal domain-containing protein [Prevotellaceae bacterium]
MANFWQIFGALNFDTLVDNPDFKEDSVREVIILPILKELGYAQENIVRSKTLEHPFLKIGSNKKIPVKLVPDYALKVENNFAWVLDAKAPNKKIVNDENVEQVYSYAIHPEIRTTYFALCNGVEFSLFRTSNPQQPILFFPIADIENHWATLKMYLSPDSFQIGKSFSCEIPKKREQFDYLKRPLLEEIPVKKQAAKRHFGCNAYFTRQTWNVVQEYVKNFSKPGDLVLDPFGGSGITVVEALMAGRKAIHIDLNPLSVFIAKSLIAPVCKVDLVNALDNIKAEYQKKEPKTDEEIIIALKKKYNHPQNLTLPKNADVDTVEELFSDKQIAQLALLKHLIKKIKNINVRDSLLLAFYNTVSVINKTFHETPKGGGNHFGYYYRYRIAPNPAYKNTIEVFESKVKRVIDGKLEMSYFINEETISNAQIRKGTATDLSFLPRESIDYIYTDPPYGKKIPYLDLSVMWNAWLDLDVTEEDYKLEAIEGGEHGKTKDDYNGLIAQSIREMYRVLKYDRWLSFVFAHKDPEFWHLIIDTAESCGFEYAGAVPQKNGQTSFKKRQNPFTVLSGQLIINFRKVRNPKSILKANLGMDISEIVMQTVEGIIAKNHGATLEQINDELIIKGLELGFLDLLKKEYADLTPLLMSSFDYDTETEVFTIRKDTKFTTQIDIHLRIKYYLLSYLRRKERENKVASFDEIILEILPLLKNGTTPENQTVLNVLEYIAERVGTDGWRLKQNGQTKLFC